MPNPENLEGQGFHTDPDRINKEGRPKGSRNLSTVLKEMLEQEVTVDIDGKKQRIIFRDSIIQKLLIKANTGDMKAITEIFDRTEGKAQSNIKVEVNEPIKSLSIEPASNKDK